MFLAPTGFMQRVFLQVEAVLQANFGRITEQLAGAENYRLEQRTVDMSPHWEVGAVNSTVLSLQGYGELKWLRGSLYRIHLAGVLIQYTRIRSFVLP